MTNTEIPEISDDIKAKCLIRTVVPRCGKRSNSC